MPDIVAHSNMAHKVLEGLEDQIVKEIDKDQYGFIRLLTNKQLGKMVAVSYRNNLRNDKDLFEYFHYEDIAIDYGKQLVVGEHRYLEGYTTEESFSEMIGNKDFEGTSH